MSRSTKAVLIEYDLQSVLFYRETENYVIFIP